MRVQRNHYFNRIPQSHDMIALVFAKAIVRTLCFRRYLLRRFGLSPWMKTVDHRRLMEFLADRHHERSLVGRCLQDWKHQWRSSQIMKGFTLL